MQVTSRFTVVSFGYISKLKFPDWVYHNFDRRFSEETSSASCSVEILAIETISGRLLTNTSGGSTLEVPVPFDSGGGSLIFRCMHYRSQHFVRIPTGMTKRVPHTLPFWCLPPPSLGDALLQKRIDDTCQDLRTTDLHLELFVKSDNAQPNVDVSTHFTTTMGSYPLAARPDISDSVVIHAVMPYHRVDRFNKIIFHMWMSYHALMGFHVVSSIPNVAFYDELPRHVAEHPNITHFDSTILGAVHQDCPSLYNSPYVVEFEKFMLATFVRFEYRVLYGARFVVNADPDEFVMAPHGPGFEKYNFSPFTSFVTSAAKCNAEKYIARIRPKSEVQKKNAFLVGKYLESTNAGKGQSSEDMSSGDRASKPSPVSSPFATANDNVHFVPLKLTEWRWTAADQIGIEQQAKFINWVVREVFALSVNHGSNVTNLQNFKGKALEVVMHKQYVSTENTTSACIASMLNDARDDVYTFSKCFDYLSVMHPGSNKNYVMRSKYMNINQACVSDSVHFSCVQNNHMNFKKHFISSSAHCLCHKVINQPYLFLMHFRENGKDGGHKLKQIKCTLGDHEDTIEDEFKISKTQLKAPYPHSI